MFTPSTRPYDSLPGYQRTFADGKLTLGLFFPIEAFAGDTPTMTHQVELAKRAEETGFATLWFRDVPLRDPSFGDVGQIFDPWVYLGLITAHTQKIALGTGSIVVPIRHPLHLAKAAASIDQLSNGRLLLGVASGDRPVEFPAFGVDADNRDELFREYLRVMKEALGQTFVPVNWQGGHLFNADLIPKPVAREIPLLITGNSRQSLEWIARNGNGWISYPRQPASQQIVVRNWQETVKREVGEVFKPFSQSLYVDLAEDPNHTPQPIHLGFRLGRNHLIELLNLLQSIGVNHVMLNLKYSQRPANEVVEELGQYVVPEFPHH